MSDGNARPDVDLPVWLQFPEEIDFKLLERHLEEWAEAGVNQPGSFELFFGQCVVPDWAGGHVAELQVASFRLVGSVEHGFGFPFLFLANELPGDPHYHASLAWPLEAMEYWQQEFGIRDRDGFALAFAETIEES